MSTRAVPCTDIPDALAKGAAVDAALGYPIAGTDGGTGRHVDPRDSRTLRHADPIMNPADRSVAYPVDARSEAKLAASDRSKVVTLDATWEQKPAEAVVEPAPEKEPVPVDPKAEPVAAETDASAEPAK